jgi:hypothetical protein
MTLSGGDSANERPEFANRSDIEEAADVFVASLGWRNASYLAKNLIFLVPASDAIKALNGALTRDFNIYRQEKIRADA